MNALAAAAFLLALVHGFPARKHLVAFVASPSLSEGWKGFGALLALALFLLHPRPWRHWRRAGLFVGGVLAAAHAVPAVDHLPRFLSSPTWAEGWRGLGAASAVAWFTLPWTLQARAVGALARARFVRTPPSPVPLSLAENQP